MIDMHLHAVNPNLPGTKLLLKLLDPDPEVTAAALRQQMAEAGVTHALGMGQLNGPADDPLGIHSTLAVAEHVPNLFAIGIADPTRTNPGHLRAVDAQMRQGKVKALKAYLGYLHFGPEHPNYAPYYELAARHRVPFIFHTGDTYSTRAKVKYAHPLALDEVAVDHPDVNFVMAHFGNPWLIDAFEVVYKNPNVWADLCGILVGDADYFRTAAASGFLADVAANVGRYVGYAERPDRFLYGSDWPLAPMSAYRDFVRRMIPEQHRQAVFEDNARALFRLE